MNAHGVVKYVTGDNFVPRAFLRGGEGGHPLLGGERVHLHGTIFAACDKLTTGLRHQLFRVNQTDNSFTIVVYVRKKVVSF